MAHRDWDEAYCSGELPWDTGEPDPLLVEQVEAGALKPGRLLEVGCGTGTNAIWLAQLGFDVRALDVSPRAVERAKAKAKAAGVDVDWSVLDFMAGDVPGGPFDAIFDRGVLHTYDEAEDRARFARRVAALLAPGGRWLSLAGSTEGPARDHGPPRRSARDLMNAVEPVLEVELLRSATFDANLPTVAKAWLLLTRTREVEAQPSTRR